MKQVIVVDTNILFALEHNALFWTRDEKLKRHLKTQGFNAFFEE